MSRTKAKDAAEKGTLSHLRKQLSFKESMRQMNLARNSNLESAATGKRKWNDNSGKFAIAVKVSGIQKASAEWS